MFGGHHPIRAALAASGENLHLMGLGDGQLRSELIGLIDNPPAMTPASGLFAATMIVVPNGVGNMRIGLSPPGPTFAFPGDFTGLPPRMPLPAEPMGFSPFNPFALMMPNQDRGLLFELSPYSPTGADIVPIPVPRGMDDWFADLFGGPSQGQGHGGSPAASGDSDDAIRQAVLQTLQEGGAMPGLRDALPLSVTERVGQVEFSTPTSPLPEVLEDSIQPIPSYLPPSAPAVDEVFSTEAPSEAQADAEPVKPAVRLSTGSMLALCAAGVGQAVWRAWRDEHRQRQRR